MKFACCTWALAGPEATILDRLAQLGFAWIDIRAVDFSADTSRDLIAAQGLQLSCVGLSFALPPGVSLDSADNAVRTQAIAAARAGLRHAAHLGADTTYIIPGLDASAPALARYTDAVITLADEAAPLGIKLCIEHFPGRALPTIAATLAYLRAIDHPNLYLLFDIGHAQMAKEEPAAALHTAGDRLGYVHLDDNDGQGDLHWALLDGVLTRTVLRDTLTALDELQYSGGVSLELSSQLPDPYNAIQRSWQILTEITNA
ncbi:MAG: sugar phosphate isomerase/epimerase [Caldilinea sp. CFX5]|nr:sugar phosphate isomerase/epimerase [Caldilinea sp. CFX5]